MTSLLRRLIATALTVVACAAALAVPSPASAETGSITCVGTTQITFNPGLTYQLQPVHATESTQLSPCTSTVPGGITSGANVQEYTADWSCHTPLHTSSATYPLHWNNGTSSTISINYTVTSVGAVVTSMVHGSVVDGVLDGATVSGKWTYAQPDHTQCLSSEGMKEQIGPVELTITSA